MYLQYIHTVTLAGVKALRSWDVNLKTTEMDNRNEEMGCPEIYKKIGKYRHDAMTNIAALKEKKNIRVRFGIPRITWCLLTFYSIVVFLLVKLEKQIDCLQL